MERFRLYPMRKIILFLTLLFGLFFIFLPEPFGAFLRAEEKQPAKIKTEDIQQITRHPDQLLVKFQAGTKTKDRQSVHARYGGKIKEKNMPLDVERISISENADIKLTLEQYQKDPQVEWAQPVYLYRALWEPDDPYYRNGLQWNLSRINAPAAWNIARGEPAIAIAVVDTGADFSHPDLSGNLLPGYNVLAPGTLPADDCGHGTHVAGIIAAETNNNLGVAGVAGECRLLPVKALDSEGYGDTLDIAEGIRWAADNGAKVINMSLGGAAEDDFVLKEAVEYAHQRSVVIVAASGNDSAAEVNAPACYAHVVAVGSSSKQDSLSTFSNYGEALDMLAPGEGIYSAYPVNKGSYASCSGTSMATPQVSATAALIFAIHPDYSAEEVETLLEFSALDLLPEGWDNHSGYGLLNAETALNFQLPSTDYEEIEDWPGAALELEMEQTAVSVVNPADDEDWFHLILPEDFSAGRVTLEISSPAALDGVVDVYTGPQTPAAPLSENDLSLLKTVDFWGAGKLDAGSWDATAGQSFYLKMRDFNTRWSLQPYSLLVTAHPQIDAREPNDTAEQLTFAKALVPGKEIGASLYPDGDQDWFKLDASGPGMLTATVTPPEEIDPVFEVYRLLPDSGIPQKIAGIDYGKRGQTEELNFNLPAAGKYYLRVIDYFRSYGSFSKDSYYLKALYPAAAGGLKGRVQLQGLAQGADSDGIKITLDPAGTVLEGIGTVYTYTLEGGNFDTENITPGGYRMKAEKEKYLSLEKDIEITPGWIEELDSVITLLAGDINGDSRVDILDLTLLAGSYGKESADALYNPLADLDAGGSVDLHDLLLLAGNYGLYVAD